MFLRSVKAANGRHEYLRLVENYRQGDKIRQRVVLHVGRKDLLAPHLDALVRLLQADQPDPTWVSTEEVSAPQAWTWGPVRVARHLFDSLSLGPILDGTTQLLRRGQPLSERVFPLVANRLTRPGSEHALAQWLEDFYVVTAQGSRWMPQWKAVATGEGELRTTAAVVRNPRRFAGREAPDRDGALAGVARPVQHRARAGVLRHHLDLLRGPGAGRVGAVRLQPGWQAAQPAGGDRGGDDGRLADCPSCVRRQSAGPDHGGRSGRRPAPAVRAASGWSSWAIAAW